MLGISNLFTKNLKEIFIDDQSKLTLHGLIQHYCTVSENDKVKCLIGLLNKLTYNQTIIFCGKIERAKMLSDILNEIDLKSITIHRKMNQEERYFFDLSAVSKNIESLRKERRES